MTWCGGILTWDGNDPCVIKAGRLVCTSPLADPVAAVYASHQRPRVVAREDTL